MKPVQPIYLRGGGCRVLLCGYNIYAGVRLSRFSTCSGSIYSSISAIEEARRKILKNMNISYALKEMIIKIGG